MRLQEIVQTLAAIDHNKEPERARYLQQRRDLILATRELIQTDEDAEIIRDLLIGRK